MKPFSARGRSCPRGSGFYCARILAQAVPHRLCHSSGCGAITVSPRPLRWGRRSSRLLLSRHTRDPPAGSANSRECAPCFQITLYYTLCLCHTASRTSCYPVLFDCNGGLITVFGFSWCHLHVTAASHCLPPCNHASNRRLNLGTAHVEEAVQQIRPMTISMVVNVGNPRRLTRISCLQSCL
jgi:hypothetical protein